LEPALKAMNGQFSVARNLMEAATHILQAETQRATTTHLMHTL
jgi:hypothetical protein